MQLLRNVYQVAGPLFAVHQNVYAIKDNNSIVLVDTGMDGHDYAVIEKNLEYWNLSQYPVSYVLITHSHYEHCANAYRFRERGAIIVAHAIDAEGIEAGDDRTASYAFINKDPFVPSRVDKKVEGGSVIKAGNLRFEVIHAPGHSNGSVIYKLLMDNKVILFTGDTVLTGKLCMKSALGWTGGVDYCQDAYVQSLEKISKLQADVILPGHGEVCMRNADRLLVGAYLEARLTLLNAPSCEIKTNDLLRKKL